MTLLLDGRILARKIRALLKQRVQAWIARGNPTPGLAVILVGDDPPSHIYVRMKARASRKLGMQSWVHVFPGNTPQENVQRLIEALNQRPEVHGILVQLPLPEGYDEARLLQTIHPEKDVDALHPWNAGLLAQRGREPFFYPATPMGIMFMLRAANIPLEGAEAVVIGRSNIVGIPMFHLLTQANATVTLCHSRTQDLKQHTRRADVLVVAVGRPYMVKGDWIKPGATVIDVGINRVDDPTQPRGYRIVGDVHFEEAANIAGAITPVPGGVGPMTIAMLLVNTFRAACLQQGQTVTYEDLLPVEELQKVYAPLPRT